MQIGRRYQFESAHFLPKVPEGHKCKRLHGHHYSLEVTLTGPINDVGFIVDFWDLDAIVQPLVNKVDHYCLNDIDGLENPTAENISIWFFNHIKESLPSTLQLVNTRIYETKDCWADVTVM